VNKISWTDFGNGVKDNVAPCQKAKEDNEVHISILPNEMLSIIFDFFNIPFARAQFKQPRDVCAIAFTCRHWYIIEIPKIIAILNPTFIKKADTRTIQHSNSNNSQEVGIPIHVGCKGAYLKYDLNDDFAFHYKDGRAEARVKLNGDYYFFDPGILVFSYDKVQQLQPYTAEVKDEITWPKEKRYSRFFVEPTGQSALVYFISATKSYVDSIGQSPRVCYQIDKGIYFCDLNAIPISAKEIQLKEKEKFIFNNLKFDGDSLLLVQQPRVSVTGEATSMQFSLWRIKNKISNLRLHQIGQNWDTKITIYNYNASEESFRSLTSVRHFYLLNDHVVATDTWGHLFYHDFKTKEQQIDDLARIAPEETIAQLCCAGETTSILNTIYSTESEYLSGKIYVWKHISGEIKLIHALEERGRIVHMHVVGMRIIVASEKGSILIVGRDLCDEIIYKYEGDYNTWSIPPSHAIGQANQLAVKFVKPGESGHQKEEAVVLFDFAAEEKKEKTAS
jgi:hypothetical protein